MNAKGGRKGLLLAFRITREVKTLSLIVATAGSGHTPPAETKAVTDPGDRISDSERVIAESSRPDRLLAERPDSLSNRTTRDQRRCGHAHPSQ